MFSKTAHIPVIEEIAKGLKAAGMNQRYLELGIAKAKCFNVVAPHFNHYVAVDCNQKAFDFININRKTQFVGTTDSFFDQFLSVYNDFNLIFIDASHKFEQVQKDFDNSWSVLAQNGIICIHDTHSPSKEWNKHCEDAWLIQPYLKSLGVEYVTLPFYFGITIIRKI